MADATANTETEQTTVTPADVAAAHEAMKETAAEESAERSEGGEERSSEEKTFTQEDVDRIVSERLKRDVSKRDSEIEKLNSEHQSKVDELKQERDSIVRDLTIRVAVAESGLPAEAFENVDTEAIPGFAEKLSSIVSQRVSEAGAAKGGAPAVPGVGTGRTSSVQTRDEIAAEVLGL